MSDREVPEDAREALERYFSAGEAVECMWLAQWAPLGGRRFCDVWREDPARCLAAVELFV
jgi:hypothetical protein